VNVCLLYSDREFDWEQKISADRRQVAQDLNLDVLLAAARGDDPVLATAAEKVLLVGSCDLAEIQFRQEVLKDFMAQVPVLSELYAMAMEALEQRRRAHLGIFTRHAESMMHEAIPLLRMLFEYLEKVRDWVRAHVEDFRSPGLQMFGQRLEQALDDSYLNQVRDHLEALAFRQGMVFSAQLGPGLKGQHYVLHQSPPAGHHWNLNFFRKSPETYTVVIADRDESGHTALGELKDLGLARVARGLVQAADHILAFFKQLRMELAFYLGCLNLAQRLQEIQEPVTFPTLAPANERVREASGLYDVCLALQLNRRVVENDCNAEGISLTIVTGANQGGKSTFLRSLGMAQLMMQSGMFVAATRYHGNICSEVFTHFGRREDQTMESGKLDEELRRCASIVDGLQKNGLVLFNESFASTNEREGSEVARQITQALVESHIQVVFVTHLVTFANQWQDSAAPWVQCLRAERRDDGVRTFKIVEGAPLSTSFGRDVYRKIFGELGEEDPEAS
jgi:hypothetical protein